jgi:hypothetical protein
MWMLPRDAWGELENARPGRAGSTTDASSQMINQHLGREVEDADPSSA